MDTSEKYILMCKKSPMKEDHEWNRGDLFYDPDLKVFGLYLGYQKQTYSQGIHGFNRDYEFSAIGKRDIPYHYIPIFRQDQLQAMIYPEYFAPLQTLCGVLYNFAISEYGGKFTIDGSMEQLLLGFVIHEKYQKQWDEEKGQWIGLT